MAMRLCSMSIMYDCVVVVVLSDVEPTLHCEMNRGVDHPHFILGNTGQHEVVVLSADIDQSQVHCMNVVAES